MLLYMIVCIYIYIYTHTIHSSVCVCVYVCICVHILYTYTYVYCYMSSVCLLPNTAEDHRKAAAEHAGHAERSAEHAFSRTRFQQGTLQDLGSFARPCKALQKKTLQGTLQDPRQDLARHLARSRKAGYLSTLNEKGPNMRSAATRAGMCVYIYIYI